jgi:hypothetical protein
MALAWGHRSYVQCSWPYAAARCWPVFLCSCEGASNLGKKESMSQLTQYASSWLFHLLLVAWIVAKLLWRIPRLIRFISCNCWWRPEAGWSSTPGSSTTFQLFFRTFTTTGFRVHWFQTGSFAQSCQHGLAPAHVPIGCHHVANPHLWPPEICLISCTSDFTCLFFNHSDRAADVWNNDTISLQM